MVKISVLPKLTYRYDASPTKIPAKYYVDINKLILKFILKGNRLKRVNTILDKKKVGGLTLPDFKITVTLQ